MTGTLLYLPVFVMFINFFISGFLVNIIQLVLWILVKPLNLWLYRKMNYYCLYAIWIQILFVAEWWSGSTCTVLTDDDTWSKMGNEHALVIMNHSYEVDWLMGWLVCEQSRLLASSKVFMKKAIKWVPILGWAWQFGEIIFLERNWEKDKLSMEASVRSLGNFPDPVWLLLFAEGTRFTSAKHAASVEFAYKSGLLPLQHLLLPRTKGFLLTIEQLRGQFSAIYCATLAFNTEEGASPTLKNMMLGRRVVGEMLLERIPMNSIPEDPREASAWLHENYRHKDHMLDVYMREGVFPTHIPGHNFRGPIRGHLRPRRIWGFLIMLLTSYFNLPMVFYALLALFCSGTLNILIAVSLLFLVIAALYKAVGLTKVNQASAYGKTVHKSI